MLIVDVFYVEIDIEKQKRDMHGIVISNTDRAQSSKLKTYFHRSRCFISK